MGAYRYGMCPPSRVVDAIIDGQPTKLGYIRYLYKPYGLFNSDLNKRFEHRHEMPIWTRWEGLETPPYVAISDSKGPADGDNVLQWRQGALFVLDDPNFGGMPSIGTLKITGKGRSKVYTIERKKDGIEHLQGTTSEISTGTPVGA